MKKIPLGRSDVTISSVVMGMWQAGKAYWVDIQDEESISAVHAALDTGMTTFDTAEEYGEGHSEKILGQALKNRPREQFQILSKVFSNHLKKDQVVEACHRSLKNLQMDYLDLYQIHWPSGSWNSDVVPIQETMEALVQLKEQGKIRSIGVSNFSVKEIEEAARFGPIDSLQPPYSLYFRGIEKDLQPYCRENKITVLAYSPLAQGFLTGRFDDQKPVFKKGDNRSANRLLNNDVYPTVVFANRQLREIAQSKNCSLAQLALAWVASHPNTAPIAGARTADQVRDNAGAAEVALTRDEIASIETIVAPVSDRFLDETIPWN